MVSAEQLKRISSRLLICGVLPWVLVPIGFVPTHEGFAFIGGILLFPSGGWIGIRTFRLLRSNPHSLKLPLSLQIAMWLGIVNSFVGLFVWAMMGAIISKE